MKKLTGIAALACWAIAASGEPIDRTVDADPQGFLEVSNISGEISIQGWDRDEVRVAGELSDDAERLDILREGNRVIVRVVFPESSGNRDRQRSWDDTELSISAPQGTSIKVDTVSADVSVIDIDGDQDLTVVSGDVSTVTSAGDVRVKSVNGDVTLQGSDDLIRTDVSVVNGDVELDGISGEIQAQSVSGDVRVNSSLFGRGEIRSVNGDINLRTALAADARLRLMTTSGDVRLIVRGDSAGAYTLSSLTGDLDNCFGPEVQRSRFGPPSTQLNFSEGDSDAQISINTMSGDISLCRDEE